MKKSIWKKLTILPLSIVIISTPLLITSCSNSNTSDTNENVDTQNYTTNEMVEKGTNDKELNSQQKYNQNVRFERINSTYERLLSAKQSNNQYYDIVSIKVSAKNTIIEADQYRSTIKDLIDSAYNDELLGYDVDSAYKNIWNIEAQMFKDVNIEYLFVSKEQYGKLYNESFKSVYSSGAPTSTLALNKSYSWFLYYSYLYLGNFGAGLIYKLCNVSISEADINTTELYSYISYFTNYSRNNMRNEINLYKEMYE